MSTLWAINNPKTVGFDGVVVVVVVVVIIMVIAYISMETNQTTKTTTTTMPTVDIPKLVTYWNLQVKVEVGVKAKKD